MGLAVLMRLAVLLVIPLRPEAVTDRPRWTPRDIAAEKPTPLQILQRRTDFRQLDQDEGAYDNVAQNIAAGRGHRLDFSWMINTPGQPTMYAGAGYPLFVAAFYRVFGNGGQLPVFLAQIVLHALSVGLVALTAARLAGPWAGATAGAFLAFHPPLIWLSVAMMSENVMIPLVAVTLWLLLCAPRRWGGRWWLRPLALGLALGALAQTRSTFAAYIAVACLWLLIEARKSLPRWRALLPPAVAGLVFVAVCVPWAVRNHVIWGKFIPFSTKSGINAYFFNHDGMVVEFGPGAVDRLPPVNIFGPEIQNLPDEPARNEALRKLFQDFVREKPGKFAGLTWMRFWMALLPIQITSTSKLTLIGAWYAKGTALAAWLALAALLFTGRLKGRRLLWRLAPLLLLLAMWQALQSLAGPGMRYRTPVEPGYAVLIGVAVAVVAALVLPRLAGHPLASRWLRRRASA